MKQYLLMLTEQHIGLMKALMPAFQFVEVESMAIDKNESHRLLVSPIPPPVIEAHVPEQDVADEPVAVEPIQIPEPPESCD